MSATHFNFGARVAAATLGIDASELNSRIAQDKVMSSSEADPFKRELCKIASAAFISDGAANTPTGILFRNLATVEEWNPGYDRFSDCVKRAMAKQALLPVVAAMHDKLGGGVVKTLLAAGALGGAGVGSLAFLLGRNASQSSAENAAMLEKVRAFKQLRREIEEDMNSDERMKELKAPNTRERYDA